MSAQPNVTQAVPFLWVLNMETSLGFYIDGVGFERKNQWIDQGRMRWCWLSLGGASLMLQEYPPERVPPTNRGEGISICFQCRDALATYRDLVARGLTAQRPFVGNGMWVTIIVDPDGYKLDFESPTDAPEGSVSS